MHIFGAASSPWIANSSLRRVADNNTDDFIPSVVAAVRRNFYVDDALPSANDEKSENCFARGGFNLEKLTSNSKKVQATIQNDKRSKPELDLDLAELPVERTLGVR